MESLQASFKLLRHLGFFYMTFYLPEKLNPTTEEELLIHLISSGSLCLRGSDTLNTKCTIYLGSGQFDRAHLPQREVGNRLTSNVPFGSQNR